MTLSFSFHCFRIIEIGCKLIPRRIIMSSADGVIDKNFPTQYLVPKHETGALNFLNKYPEFDGKDVTIAIFDSGVDPTAVGLKETSNDEIKVIERFDCSGCGDVDTSKKVTVSNEGFITGLSGRNLKITDVMKSKNKTNEYHIGLKNLEDLFPSRVRDKANAEAKQKFWDEPQKKAVADVSRAITELDTKNSQSTSATQSLPFKDKLVKENLDSTLEFLNSFEKKYLSEIRISYDCIVFETAEGWMAVIDTTDNGDLENAILISEFSKTHEVANIHDYYLISINVHDDGNVLEIVGMCSSHGTHVASIASGYHIDNREIDGVAPAAKIVSLTIGDGRLGSMETGTALVRGIIKVMELCEAGTKIDVINMSYGEHCHWSSSGRIGELMNEVVNKYGVVWVASAGNHGPALSTIGTPPDISQPSCIGVGAYVSPEMMEAEYVLRNKLPGNVYTWTSRDPCIDGGNGVTICAPGAAITSVPQFTMARSQLMNGTSMAAPNVAGSIALLISGLKKLDITYTPYSIKRALANTATFLNTVDPFAQGSGLINVEKAFEYLKNFAEEKENKLRFSISVGACGAKGIHMRNGRLVKPEEFAVTIEPVFFNEKEVVPGDKIDYNVRLALVSECNWVQCGSFLDLCYLARTISVKIDPTNLAPGVHKSHVRAYDTNCIDKGVLFEIPITVIQPHDLSSSNNEYKSDTIICKPNTILRNFFLVPKYATYATLEMKSEKGKDNYGGKFMIHTQQILPMKYCKALETQKLISVNSEDYTLHTFKCTGDNIVEICIAKYWSNFGEIPLKFEVKFNGTYSTDHIMHSARGIHRIDLKSLNAEEILPSISLKTAVMVLKPTESKISPLTKRDVLPKERQIYQNILTYNLHITKACEASFNAPLLSNVLYESEFESQFWMLFDSNKMQLASGDAYSENLQVKLDKGDYVIRLQVRHEKKDLLERVSDATFLVNFKLSNALNPDIYRTYNQAVINGKKISSFQMQPTVTKPIYVASITNEKLQKAPLPSQCSWLEGTIVYTKDEVARRCDTRSFQYILTEGPPAKKNGNGTKDNKNKLDEFKEGLRDYQNSMIPKLDLDKAEEVYNDVIAANPTFMTAHLSLIQNIDTNEIKTQLPLSFVGALTTDVDSLRANLKRIIDLADLAIQGIDNNSLLAYYGLKTDTRPDAAKIKTNMEKQKQVLIEAYVKKFIALSKLRAIELKASSRSEPGESLMIGDQNILEQTGSKTLSACDDELNDIYLEIGKFIDYMDAKVLLITIWHGYVFKQYGRMLKGLTKLYDEKYQRDVLEEIRLLAGELNYVHIQKIMRSIISSANPQTYRLF